MKRRLRKKKRVGEFQEFGFEVSFDLSVGLGQSERNTLINRFITEAIEANGLQFGGGGDQHWQGFATVNRTRGSATEQHRQAVYRWLKKEGNVGNIHVGTMRDAWYGWESH